ncbi:MAG: hypothetical protein IH855_03525 [Bacteroidetes bacterium]|nr:hypothetical protein [Bacteroidota bacterium]
MFVPEYNKPEAPGVHMGFDNTVSVYHIVEEEDTFEVAAQAVFDLLKDAQERFPDWSRVFFLDIAGHEGEAAGFSPDFYEFQQEFLFSVVTPFVSAFETPLTGGLVNPDSQRNDLPDRLNIGGDVRPNSGTVVPNASG